MSTKSWVVSDETEGMHWGLEWPPRQFYWVFMLHVGRLSKQLGSTPTIQTLTDIFIPYILGRLKMRDMKMRDGQKCRGGKCGT